MTETSTSPGQGARRGHLREDLLGHRPVDGEVILPADAIVVYPGGMRSMGIDHRLEHPDR
jgi:hypothetical protein